MKDQVRICGVERHFYRTIELEGASAALPVWAYFYNKVESDKTLPYSDTAGFAKPEVGVDEPNYDYINNIHLDLGAQGDDIGNGQSSDYEQGYDNTNPQNLAPESDTQNQYEEGPVPADNNKPPLNKNNKLPLDTSQKPKAIMPKKDGDGKR